MKKTTMKHLTKFALIPLLIMMACATGPSFYANPLPPATPATIMKDHACATLPVDRLGSTNPIGWLKKPPVGMVEMTCGSKYVTGPFYCSKATDCKTLVWSTSTPVGIDSAGIHPIVDLLKGSIKACASTSSKFGVGSLNCKAETYTAMPDKPIRIVLAIQSIGQAQPGIPVSLEITPVSDQVIVGQIGTAEALN